MVNINRLKGKMVEKGVSVSDMASQIGINRASLYRRLKDNGENLRIKDVCQMADILALSQDEAAAIFFQE